MSEATICALKKEARFIVIAMLVGLPTILFLGVLL
jgi:hypothetical protein